MKHTDTNTPIIVVTPFHGSESILEKLKEQLISQFSEQDKWVIVYDNIKPKNFLQIANKQIVVLQNNFNPGAGNARNIALEYIQDNHNYPFLLYPIDSDDEILPNAILKIKKSFKNYSDRIISFGHIKAWKNKKVNFGFDGIYSLRSLLHRYITPCGSTVIKIESYSEIKDIRFGHRKRANDQLFFLNAVKKFKCFRCISEPILLYKITDSNSISSKKYRMIVYKYLALRDFGISRTMTLYYMVYYAYFGVMRHIFKIGV